MSSGSPTITILIFLRFKGETYVYRRPYQAVRRTRSCLRRAFAEVADVREEDSFVESGKQKEPH